MQVGREGEGELYDVEGEGVDGRLRMGGGMGRLWLGGE